MDESFLSAANYIPYMNAARIAGNVITIEPLKGKPAGISCAVGCQKPWPHGGAPASPPRCYRTGERVAKASGQKIGAVAPDRVEIMDNGRVDAPQLEQRSDAEHRPSRDDGFLAGLETS